MKAGRPMIAIGKSIPLHHASEGNIEVQKRACEDAIKANGYYNPNGEIHINVEHRPEEVVVFGYQYIEHNFF